MNRLHLSNSFAAIAILLPAGLFAQSVVRVSIPELASVGCGMV